MNIVSQLSAAVKNGDVQQVKTLFNGQELTKEMLIFVIDEVDYILLKPTPTQIEADMLGVLCSFLCKNTKTNTGEDFPLARAARSGNTILFDSLMKVYPPQTRMKCLSDSYVYHYPDIVNICVSHWDNQCDKGHALMGAVRSGSLEYINMIQRVSHLNTPEHVVAMACFVGNKKIYQEFLPHADSRVAMDILQWFEKADLIQEKELDPLKRQHLGSQPVKEAWNGAQTLRVRAGILEGVEGLGKTPAKKKM